MRYAFLAAAVLAGCAATPSPADDGVPQYYQDAFLAYRDCVYDEADRLALANATPATVAEAAVASCEPQFLTYREAVRRGFTENVALRDNRERARLDADIKAEETRRALSGIAMRYVLEARAPK